MQEQFGIPRHASPYQAHARGSASPRSHGPDPVLAVNNINEQTSKAEIISAALELTDHQAETISQLQQQAKLLWLALALALAWQVIA